MSQSVVPKTGKNECDTEQSFQDTKTVLEGKRAKFFQKPALSHIVQKVNSNLLGCISKVQPFSNHFCCCCCCHYLSFSKNFNASHCHCSDFSFMCIHLWLSSIAILKSYTQKIRYLCLYLVIDDQCTHRLLLSAKSISILKARLARFCWLPEGNLSPDGNCSGLQFNYSHCWLCEIYLVW